MKKFTFAFLLLATALLASSAFAQQNPILFVTQIPNPGDFATANSAFGTQSAALGSIPRGGDLYIRYANGHLKNLTAAAGFGVASGLQGATSIAVRDPAVHWSGTKAIFSMVIGAATRQFEVGQYRWQLYEVTGLGENETPVVTKVPNQPAGYNNVAATYGTDDRIIFATDRPRNGQTQLYPQLDEYEVTPTVSGLWSLNPATGDLFLLEHSPSGSFTPIIDSFGRVIFTRWDHLQQDQLATDGSAAGTAGAYGMFDYTDESATAQRLFGVRKDIYPEARIQTGSVSGHLFNLFFPWMIEQDGTGMETINHVGRHELLTYFDRSFIDDTTLREFNAPANSEAQHLANGAIHQMKEDPLVPGRFLGISAPEFASHACGQIVALKGAPGLNAEAMQIESLTHPDTAHLTTSPSANHSGLYRNPLPTSDGLLIASHTTSTQEDGNTGSGATVGSRYDLRLKLLTRTGTYFVPAGNLTPGISKSVEWWDPDARRTYSGPLWELQPVEVRTRPRPAARPSANLDTPEAAVFARAGVDVEAFKTYLRANNLALIVMRNVTSRDDADRQQPFNLRVPGGVASATATGKVYDVSHLQIFQGDQVRGRGLFSATGTPGDGRRVLARELHDTVANNPAAGPGAPAGGLQIAPDGSVAALVPARRALTWQLTSPTTTPVVRERFWLSFQPGEIRTCTSCHGVNDRDQLNRPAPQNEPQALATLLAFWKGTPPPPPTATPPSAPTNLTASVVSSTQVNLSWTDASSNEDGFQIERSIGSGGFVLLATVGANVTTFANSGLTPSTTYNYRVRAVNPAGSSAFTATASATTVSTPPPPPPPPPATAPAAPTNLAARAISSTQINLSWSDGSNNETGFQIERSTGTNAFALLTTVGANVTTFANTGLSPSTAYTYRVRAINAAGNSAFTAAASATTVSTPPPPPATVPSAPTHLTATATSSTRIRLTWKDTSSNESGFQIERSTSGGAFTLLTTVAPNVTAFSSRGLTPSTTYSYRIRAVNATGHSAFTAVASATTPAVPTPPPPPPPPPPPTTTAPAAPTNLAATAASSSQVNLSWTDASNNETGFQVERSTGGSPFTLLTTVAANVTAFSDNGLTASTTYSYRVRASNAAGNSAFTATVSATTPAAPGGSGAVFFVSTTGNNSNNGLTAATAFATLQFCANRANPGDTYLVADGDYAGFNLSRSGTAGKPITFKASGANVRIVTPNTFTSRDGINLEGANWSVIEGFTCSNLPRAGIRAVTGDHNVIRGNTCESNGTWGIFTGFTNDLTVENNTCALSKTQHGIYVSNSSDRATLRNNRCHHNFGAGIQINADASQGGDGISTGCRIYNNVVWENGAGGGAAINLDGVVGAEIFNNLLYENHATGIALFQQDGAVGSSGATIYNNTIVHAANGRWCILLVDGATGTTLRNNIIITQHPTHGTIAVDASSITGLNSDFNLVTNRLGNNGDATAISLTAWRSATGQDAHSSVAPASIDSLFVNRASGNFQLAAGSAAINAGTTLTFAGAALDALGVARPQGGAFDDGAFEFTGSAALSRL